jgi:hypothetical protein
VTNRSRRRLGRAAIQLVASGAFAAALAGSLHAQQTTPQPPSTRTQAQRRPETIEIRGQVPTPQVVTVRPREAPAYSRRVLVPAFFDRSFWPSILPPIQIVAPVGPALGDTVARSTADSATRARPAGPRAPSGTPPALQRP